MKAFIVLAFAAVAAAQLQVQGPGVQVQFPGRQQPQPPTWQQPQPPTWQQPPTRPNIPGVRAWRLPVVEPRCPPAGTDNTNGNAVIFNDPTNPASFRKCWGGLGWPFDCPTGTVWWAADPTGPSCAFQSQIDAARNQWNPQFPNLRQFDSENAAFAEDVAEE